MYHYKIHLEDGSDAGEASYAEYRSTQARSSRRVQKLARWRWGGSEPCCRLVSRPRISRER
jgi:hypothetical protein